MVGKKIESADELEFVVFCIEGIAARLSVSTRRVYMALTQGSDILSDYIVPEYDVLHSQSKEYIIDDILDVMAERGIEV